MELFTREGKLVTPNAGSPEKPAYRYIDLCYRCGGKGGSQAWAYTGYYCYLCRGTGKSLEKTVPLYTAEKLAKLQAAEEKRYAAKLAKAEAKAKAEAVERQQRIEAMLAEHADFIAKLRSLDGEFWVGFRDSFFVRAEAPTERQIALVEAEVAKRAANAASGHFGTVGEKITITATIERIIRLDSQWGANWINILRSGANVASYKGQVDLGCEGDTVTLTATVADHTEYKGTKQTILKRPKVV